jgi:hypothetical protein
VRSRIRQTGTMIIRYGKAVRLLVSVIAGSIGFGELPGNAAANTVIELTYDSVMDMVRPEVHPGIAVHHNLQITVSGGGNLSEGRNRSAGPYQDRNAMMQVLSSSGDDAAYASWRVAPDGRLVRIQNDPQSTRTMTVTLLPGNTCRLDVVDQLKPGFSEYAFLRISTHTIGYFSTYRVTRTSCAIH